MSLGGGQDLRQGGLRVPYLYRSVLLPWAIATLIAAGESERPAPSAPSLPACS